MGPQRGRLTPEDKNPIPENLEMKVLDENVELAVEGEKHLCTIYSKEWDEVPKEGNERHIVLKAWVADGIALPLKWTLTSSDSSKGDSESELVKRQEIVKVDGKDVKCKVTVTRKKIPEGVITKTHWTSTKIPGFMVKMESQMEAQGFSMEIKEHITGYSVK
ncbi:MAG: hypothetical protein L0956_07875, partial [Candidatus Mariimomonas ferrooxydans]